MEPEQWQYGQLTEAGAINNSLITFDVFPSGTLMSAPGGRTPDAWRKIVAELGEQGWIFCSVLPDTTWLFRRPLETPKDIPDLPPVQFGV